MLLKAEKEKVLLKAEKEKVLLKAEKEKSEIPVLSGLNQPIIEKHSGVIFRILFSDWSI